MQKVDRGSPEAEESDAVDRILVQIVKLVAEVRKRQSQITEHHGVTMLEYQAIHVLRKQGDINIKQLANQLHLNQSTVSSLINRMEKKRLARRVQDSRDRRSVKIRLTDIADEITEYLPVSPIDFFKVVLMQSLTADERSSLMGLLEKIGSSVEMMFSEIDFKNI